MKLIICLLTFSFTHVSAALFSQQITYSAQRVSIEKVLKEVERQSGFNIFYKYDKNLMSKAVDVNFKNTALKAALDQLLSENGLTYTVDKKTIIINRFEESKVTTASVAANIQDNTLRGKVIDSETGEPLIGATIRVKGTGVGTAADQHGAFLLRDIKAGTSMEVIYTGYRTHAFIVGDNRSMTIRLVSEQDDLEEVVVTGYQTIDKRTFTGSVSKVKGEDLATAGLGDVGKSLQGMVAGVAVENTSGTFGTKSKIRIRGNSSISGNQEPLWVVDGIVLDDPINVNPNQLYSGDAATMLSSAISGVNPDDIEDIQILKDASATAMYGTQAVNGVIVVTTKKGRVGKPVVSYKNTFSVSLKPTIEDFNVMNSKQRMEFSEEMFDKNLIDFPSLNATYGMFGKLLSDLSLKNITWEQYYKGINRAKTFNTDWFDVIFKNSLTQEHSASISTGSEKSQFYFSGSYFNDAGQTAGQGADRFTANLKGNFQLADNFSIMANIYGSSRKQQSFGTFNSSEDNGVISREFDINPYSYAYSTSRAMRPYDDYGGYEYYQMNYAPFNILNELNNNFINISAREVRLQLEAKWNITPNLSYLGIVSGRLSNANTEHVATELSNVAASYRAMQSIPIRERNPLLYNNIYTSDDYPTTILPRGGILVVDNSIGDFYTIRNSVNWKPIIDEKHSFDLMGGTEIRHRQYSTDYYKGYGYNYYRGMISTPDHLALQRDILGGNRPYYQRGMNTLREASFYANLAYSYMGKYNLTLSSRADGSNRLGSSQKFRFLPIWVIGAAWRLDEEAFLQDKYWLDNLKIRGSYGLRGNISGLGSPEMIAYYGTTNRFEEETIENSVNISSPNNPNLEWEKEHMFNAAVELGILRRFNMTLEYYNRKNYDLIGTIDVSSIGGFSRKTINWADMKNYGFEATLSAQIINQDKFNWSTILTYGLNKNEITKMSHMNTILQATVDRGSPNVGYPVNGLFSIRFAGLDNEGLPLFIGPSGDPTNRMSKYTRDLSQLKYEGSREPIASGGITNNFSYNGLQLSFLFTYSYGNKIRLNPFYKGYYNDVEALDAALANRWSAPGHEHYTNVPRLLDVETRNYLVGSSSDPYTYYNRSDIRTVDGSFIRLKNIMLGYDLPKTWITRTGLQRIQITGQAQNVGLWADSQLKGQDPEALVTGISIPAATTYTLGININF